MTNSEYKKLVETHIPKVNEVKSIITAFLVGGFIGLCIFFWIYYWAKEKLKRNLLI